MQNGIFARKRLGKRLNVTYRTERFLKSEKCAMKRNPQFVLVGLKFKQFLIALFLFSPILVHYYASGIFANQSHVAYFYILILTIKIYISCVFPIKSSTISHILIWIALDNSRDFLSFIFLDDLDFKNGNVWFTIQNARISSTYTTVYAYFFLKNRNVIGKIDICRFLF